MRNIEAFNLVVGEVFGQCYREFPCRIDISTMELGATLKEAKGECVQGELDLREAEYSFARESVQWLVDAGYLWCTTPAAYKFMGATLSPKGLEVLNTIPEGLEMKVSLGEELSQGVVALGKEATKQMVLKALSMGAKLMVGF